MTTLQRELTIERPITAVWAVFEDPANVQRWQPALQRVELLRGRPGEPGAVSRLTVRERGFPITLVETVLEARPYVYSAVYESPQVINRVVNTFEPLGTEHTRYRLTAEITLQSGWLRLTTPVLLGIVVGRIEADMQRFKQLVEGLPASSAAAIL